MAKEYIEREAAKRELLSWAVSINHPEYLIKDDALHIIDSFPAADVVEVVRCKDCKYMTQWAYGRYCTVWDEVNGMGDDGFCNYGERKGGDK